MALEGCRCPVCRSFVDGEEVMRRLTAPPPRLPPDQQALLEQIVRDAFAKTQPLNGSENRG